MLNQRQSSSAGRPFLQVKLFKNRASGRNNQEPAKLMACRRREGCLFLSAGGGAYYLRPACEPRRRRGDLGSDFEPGTGPPFTFARLHSRRSVYRCSVPVPQPNFRRRHVYRSLSLATRVYNLQKLSERLSLSMYQRLLQYNTRMTLT